MRHILRRCDIPPDDRHNAQSREKAGGHPNAHEVFGSSRSGEIEVMKCECGHTIKRLRSPFPILEVRIRNFELRNIPPVLPEENETIGRWERQGRENHSLHDTEHRGVRSNAQGEREHRNSGEAGTSGQCAHTEAQVLHENVESAAPGDSYAVPSWHGRSSGEQCA
jgi:hypothetical protein